MIPDEKNKRASPFNQNEQEKADPQYQPDVFQIPERFDDHLQFGHRKITGGHDTFAPGSG
jgi:hypothetical protein